MVTRLLVMIGAVAHLQGQLRGAPALAIPWCICGASEVATAVGRLE